MFCKFCGEKMEDNATFCSKCGANLTSEDKKDVDSLGIIDTIVPNENEQPIKKKSAKILSIIQKVVLGGLITGIVGVTLFLGIVLVGLFAYGRVYLFDGYGFTKVLSVISIVLMVIGICGIITKAMLHFKFKDGIFSTSKIKRVLIAVLAFACLGCSIWGFVDCSNNDSSGASGSNWSFATIYNECSCSYPWANVGADYLSIDTNPYDFDSDYSSSTTYMNVSLSAIRLINIKLSLPSYLYDEMIGTRALDGRQSYSGTKVNVSWHYHPDSGLEVRYTKK